MFAAESLVKTLLNQGVEVCFTNPGTSEMHMVAALDRNPDMKAVLCLFEGVATGAADGYARMSGKPACTLLHLGPGLANGLANLHNARRAHVPVVNIVGEHARDHVALDAPLTSDIAGFCKPVSQFVGTVSSPAEICTMTVRTVQEACGPLPGIASLILPADCAWENEEPEALPAAEKPCRPTVSAEWIGEAALALKSAKKPVLFLGDTALSEAALTAAGRIAQKTGAEIFMETFGARIARGAGRVTAKRLPYFGEEAMAALQDFDLIVMAGAKRPVAFFAYPDKPSHLIPADTKTFMLGGPESDMAQGLEDLAMALFAMEDPVLPPLATFDNLDGDQPLNPGYVGLSLLRHMPEQSIICDDATTSGMGVFPWLENGPQHDWLCLTGGAIGQGMPNAVGAAMACPDRQVFALCGDGAAAYTVQALWTMAREKQNVVNVVFANHSYLVLNFELARVGAGDPGPAAQAMLDLSNPKMDWVQMGEGFGLPSVRARTWGEFDAALQAAIAADGPQLIVAEI